MRNFRSDNQSRGGRDFPRRSFGGGDSRRPAMHDAVCDECGKDCQVPFRPSGDKPIYCSDCFERKGGGESRRPDRRDSGRFPQGNINDRSILQLVGKIETLNTKLDVIINLLSSAGQKKPKSTKSRAKKGEKKKT